MSEFFRTSVPVHIYEAGPAMLAHLIHQAEDTDDDILLLQATHTVTHRNLWDDVMQSYRAIMDARIAAKQRRKKAGAK
jgi:hypothetical protein